jgi:16S rRNA (guanine527-N7)-methyltransferase
VIRADATDVEESARWVAERWGVTVSSDAWGRICRHWETVQAANATQSLVGLRGRPREAFVRIVLDSVSVARWYHGQEPAVDIGSGAGYPGLVLASLYPGVEWTLVESREKKAAFLSRVLQLGLWPKARVAAVRAEALAQVERGQYGFAVARAVGTLAMVAELALPLLRQGGLLVAMQGPGGQQIPPRVEQFLARLGGSLIHQDPLDLPEQQGRRVLTVVKKVALTPDVYPRLTGGLGRS